MNDCTLKVSLKFVQQFMMYFSNRDTNTNVNLGKKTLLSAFAFRQWDIIVRLCLLTVGANYDIQNYDEDRTH